MKRSTMAWGSLALLLPLCALAQNLPAPGKLLVSPSTTYTAKLRAPGFSGSVTVQGTTWSCAKGRCSAQAPWPAPTVASCAALVAKAGQLTHFGSAKASLGADDLASCNRGVAAGVPQVNAPAAQAIAASPAAAAMRTRRLQQFGDLRQSLARAEAQAAAQQQRDEREEARRRRLALGYTHRHGQGTDCDDTRPNVNPNAAEVCDHIDNNCDGRIDEGTQLAFYLDADGDTHGDPSQRVLACPADQERASAEGRWLVSVGNDCDDKDPNKWQGCP